MQDDNFAKTNPELALDWYPTKNGKLTSNMFTKYSTFNAHWKCHKCGREDERSIEHYRGCIPCHKQEYLQVNSLATWRPDLVQE